MASRTSRRVCSLGRPAALGTGRWGSMQDHSASERSVWYALLMLGTLPRHVLKTPFRTVSEGKFSESQIQNPAYSVQTGSKSRPLRGSKVLRMFSQLNG